MDKADQISGLLLEMVAERFDKEPTDSLDCIEFGDSFAELLDRFIVLHIRMWKLEDAAGEARSSEELAGIKKKVDYCFKWMRPKLTKAINAFLDVYISKNHTRKFSEENVKLYKGYE